MANIRVTCPACKTELEVDASHEGQEVECGNCLEVFKAKPPGSSAAGGGKIPGAGSRPGGSGGSGRGRSDRPAPKKRRRDDDDDYDHDRRRDDDEFDDYDPRPRRSGGEGDGAATASLVLGIIAVVLFCCWPISGPVGLIAAVCGGLGLKSRNNRGQAIAGLALGVIGMALAALFLLGFGLGGFR